MNCCEDPLIIPGEDGRFDSCENCGHTFYDEETLALQREVLREQAIAKQVFGYIPTYKEWMGK